MSANPARLTHANEMVNAFEAAGKPRGAKPEEVRKLDRSPVGWPVTRGALAYQLRERLKGVIQPMQAGTSYCGPASFLYCLLEDRPDLYVAYATSIWTRGEYSIGNLDIDPDAGTIGALGGINAARAKAPKDTISSLDWLTMASLSIATREWFVAGKSARADDLGKSVLPLGAETLVLVGQHPPGP